MNILVNVTPQQQIKQEYKNSRLTKSTR